MDAATCSADIVATAWGRLAAAEPASVAVAVALLLPGFVVVGLEWSLGHRIELRSSVRAAAALPLVLAVAGAAWEVVLARPACPGLVVESTVATGLVASLALFVLGRLAVARARRRRKPLSPPDPGAAQAA